MCLYTSSLPKTNIANLHVDTKHIKQPYSILNISLHLSQILLKQYENYTLKVSYHAKCTFWCLLYINMCPRCVPGVSPVCPRCVRELTQRQEIKPSLFLRTQISKNGGTTELIQICVRYDVISEMWTHGPIRNVAIRNNARLFWT